MYKLIWNKEEIESDIQTLKEARYLQQEYTLAYQGSVRIVKQYKKRASNEN